MTIERLTDKEKSEWFNIGFNAAEQAAVNDDNPDGGDNDVYDFPEESAQFYYKSPTCEFEPVIFECFLKGFLAWVEQMKDGLYT